MHAHDHAGQAASVERASRKRRLGAALLIAAAFFVIELVGALFSGSLALLADATHMFTDVAALLLSYAAMSLAQRRTTPGHTFGLSRAEILAAFLNAQLLLVMSGFIFYEAYRRFHEPAPVATRIMLVVAAAGLGASLTSVLLLRGHHRESLNVKAAYLEVFTDALSSLAVIISALLMMPTGWYWLDPLVSVGIGILIVPRTVALLKESAHILMEGAPPEVDVPALRRRLCALPCVEDVHDLHVWALTSGLHHATVHVRPRPEMPHSQVVSSVRQLFEAAGMGHTTVQVECGPRTDCQTARCDD